MANTAGWINTGGTTLVGSATIAASNDTFTLAAHGLANGTIVEFRTMTGGAVGVLIDNAEYYIRNTATNTFQVSDTPGGEIITFATDGTANVYTAVPAYSALDLRRIGAITLHPASTDRLGAREGVRPHSTEAVTVAGTSYSIAETGAVIYPRETSTSGPYPAVIEALSGQALNPADGTNPRLDGVDAQLQDDDEDGSGQRRLQIVYVAGTPASSPTAPAVTDNSIRLATILVPAGGSPAPSVQTPCQYADGPGILPCRNSTERPTVGLFAGLSVWRIDLQVMETWDGTAWLNSASTKSPTQQRYTSNTTWNKPSGVKYIVVEVQAGGGAGGGAEATGAGVSSAGVGGEAGSYARSIFTAAQAPSSASVVVGAGGTGVSGGTGNNGSTSSWSTGGTLVSAAGGVGGGTISASATDGWGYNPGTSQSMTGQLTIAGQTGGPAKRGGIQDSIGGMGGNSMLGRGGGGVSGATGGAGRLYGGGGGGAANNQSTSARAGGAGAAGIVIVTEYYV